MRELKMLVLAVVFFMFLGCGGASTGNDSVYVASPADGIKAVIMVMPDKMTYQPVMIGSTFYHLSDGTKEVSVDKKHVVKVFWNGAAVGWHFADPAKGVDLGYNWSLNPTFTIAGQPLSPTFGGNFSFLIDDGRELSQITDAHELALNVGPGMVAERYSDGLLYSSPAAQTPVVPVVAKTIVNVNTVTGEVEVTPAIVNGKVTQLVNSNPVEQVLDANGQVIAGYRIVWNDNGSWYPASGKIVSLALPKTVIAGAAKPAGMGAGMPYLVRPDGTYVPFNTDPLSCIFLVNGILTKINIDGLMPY